jgi:hypothetical protein
VSNPALWAAIAGCLGALGALITAIRAHRKATDAHMIAVGHALDRGPHVMPIPLRPAGPPADPPAAEAPRSSFS